MRASNTTLQHPARPTQVDIYAFSQHQQQVSDIENQRTPQNSVASQSGQVVASRQTALIYIRERPIRPPTPTVVLPQPTAQPASLAGSGYVLSREAKALGAFFGACIVIGAGGAALKNL